jgi:phospholipase D1/2
VHAKLAIVDDRLLRIGSANLANRSMGLDSECDLGIEARDDDTAAAIADVRNDLLAEHLGTTPERVAEELRTRGSLVAAVDALRGGPRTLDPIEASVEAWVEELVPDGAIFDPERPVPPDQLLAQLLPDATGPERLRRALPWLFGVVAVAALAAAWRWTPLSEWTAPERLAALAAPLRTHAGGPWLAAGAIALAGSALVPITAMTVGAALVFGPLVGFAVALAGALASAALGFGVGRLLWGDAVRRLTGRRLARIRASLARDGVLTVAAVRLIPVAPFTIVNIAAGASSIGFRDYVLGTALAMAPGTLVLAVVTDRARRLLDEPGFGAALVVVGIVAGAAIALRIARRRLTGDAPSEQ